MDFWDRAFIHTPAVLAAEVSLQPYIQAARGMTTLSKLSFEVAGLLVVAGGMDFAQNLLDPVAIFPLGKIALKLSHIANPPNVVANAVVFDVGPLEFAAAD